MRSSNDRGISRGKAERQTQGIGAEKRARRSCRGTKHRDGNVNDTPQRQCGPCQHEGQQPIDIGQRGRQQAQHREAGKTEKAAQNDIDRDDPERETGRQANPRIRALSVAFVPSPAPRPVATAISGNELGAIPTTRPARSTRATVSGVRPSMFCRSVSIPLIRSAFPSFVFAAIRPVR